MLTFKAIGVTKTEAQMMEFWKPSGKVNQMVNLYYQEMFIAGSRWAMEEAKLKYEVADQMLKKVKTVGSVGTIIMAFKGLWNEAYKCKGKLGCTPINPGILYPGHQSDTAFMLELTESCLAKTTPTKKHECNKDKFLQNQRGTSKWSPADIAFIEVESAFRIEYADHWNTIQYSGTPIKPYPMSHVFLVLLPSYRMF